MRTVRTPPAPAVPAITITITRPHGVWRAVIDREGDDRTAVLDCSRIDRLLHGVGIDLSVVFGEPQDIDGRWHDD